jgi:hypothetical protein
MYMPVVKGDLPVVKCLIEEGGADINAMIGATANIISPLSLATLRGKYPLAQWLIEGGAIIPTKIWDYVGKEDELADAAELSSLLKVLILLPMSPDQDRYLPTFVALLSPPHAELCTRGRQLRDRLPAYMEQQEASVRTHCPLPAVLQAMVTAYARPTPEDLWSDGLQ